MSDKKTTELATELTAAELAAFASQFPQEAGVSRMMLPRLTFKSQDVMEGKGKKKVVVVEAGTFFTEHPTDEKNEEGKPVWEKKELGLEIEGLIVYRRKQLRFFDEPNDVFYSTPIFDDANDVIPLFCGKNKVATGTPAELKKSFEYTTEDGKTRSKLEDNIILYVVYNDELYQMSLRGSSMYSFLDFARKVALGPAAHLVHFTSEAQEKGSIEWNQMKFTAVRTITRNEKEVMQAHVDAINHAIETERAFYAQQAVDGAVSAAVVATLPEGAKDEDDF